MKHTFVEAVIRVAVDAGRAIMKVYNEDITVNHKDDNSPLTQADLAAHNIIDAGLQLLVPALPVLSEEAETLPYAERKLWSTYWLVDPLDGTREFIKRNGEFTVNIALIEQHEPILGVVYAPAIDLLYFAARGKGAWRKRSGEEAQKIVARSYDSTRVTIASSRSHAGDRLTAFLSAFGSHELISMGSSLKFCLVAEGRADVYPRLGPTSEWDTAAAQCVLEEAGGRVVDTQNHPFRYNTRESLLNPEFFATSASGPDWTQYLS